MGRDIINKDVPEDMEMSLGKAFMLDGDGHSDWYGWIDPRDGLNMLDDIKGIDAKKSVQSAPSPQIGLIVNSGVDTSSMSDAFYWANMLANDDFPTIADDSDTARRASYIREMLPPKRRPQKENGVTKAFDESKHPRYEAGDPRGGQFAPKDAESSTSQDSKEEDLGKRGDTKKSRFTGGKVPFENRVWKGERYPYPDKKPSKIVYGALGEELAMFVLGELSGDEFSSINVGINNAPIDVAGDHLAVEVKTGMAYVGPKSQMWRASIGEMGKQEKETYKRMDKAQKREYNKWKQSEILRRKNDIVARMSEELGEPIKGITMAIIMTPDLKRADVFRLEGFHISASWKKYATEDNYIGTYEIGDG